MGMNTGAAWFDFDRDDDLDLYVTQGVGSNKLYENQGDGTFVDVAIALGVADSSHIGSGVAVADFDNDGWLDLFLANADHDVLFKNNEGLSFSDITDQVGTIDPDSARGMSASWGDFNNDGYLDLYVANHFNLNEQTETHQDRLYLNEGGHSFADVSEWLGLDALNGYGFIGSWTDYDEDGDLDLFLINDCGFNHTYLPSQLFRNDGSDASGGWQFTEVAASKGADHCHNGMGIAVGDYDRDSHQEYFYTNIGERTLLLHYNQGFFEDTAEASGVYANHPDARALWTWGANFLDYDLDGWLDLYVVAGTLSLRTRTEVDPQPNLLFRNRADGTFEDVTSQSGLDDPKRSRTSVYGDYDNDGDPDLFLVNSDQKGYLFENVQQSGHHYLIVDLEGTLSNRDGIGARLTLTTPDGGRQYWETRSGSSLGGGDDLAAYFGLGNQDTVTSLTIVWPSGVIQTLNNLRSDQRLLVRESASITDIEETVPYVNQPTFDLYPNPFSEHLSIRVSAAHSGAWSAEVFDLLGRLVTILAPSSSQTHEWDGRDQTGTHVPAGVYVVRLSHPNGTTEHLLVARK